MTKKPFLNLSKRERQIMDAVYSLGEATAKAVMHNIPSPPTYAAVRRLIAILEEKGYLVHRKEGSRYVYSPVEGIEIARKSAISHLTETFFKGSAARTMAAILDLKADDLSAEELEELAKLIDQAREEGK